MNPLDIAIDKLIAASVTHRDIAKDHLRNDAVYTSRMTASLVCSTLVEVLLALRHAELAARRESSTK